MIHGKEKRDTVDQQTYLRKSYQDKGRRGNEVLCAMYNARKSKQINTHLPSFGIFLLPMGCVRWIIALEDFIDFLCQFLRNILVSAITEDEIEHP